MNPTPLYLFKAARRPLYRKENLRLLAEERGTIVEVSYNRSWVAAEYFDPGAIARGTPVYFIFTDPPYELFVPVRTGEIVDATWDDLMLHIRISLGNWTGLENMDLQTFTQIVKQTGSDCVPGRKFIGPKRDSIDLIPFYDEREDEGWSLAVDNVLAMSAATEDDPYRDSVFFRTVGTRVGEGDLNRARRLPMAAGTEGSLLLHFHNPHLTETQLDSHSLVVTAPEDEMTVIAPESIPGDGELEIGLQILDGNPQLTIQIGPAAAQHTQIIERFRTSNGLEHVNADPVDSGRRTEELLSIYDFIRRNAQFTNGDQQDFFDRFAQLLPDETRIREDWGLCCERAGDYEAAYRILKDLDPEGLSDTGRFVLFRIGIGRDPEISPLLAINRFELATESRFDQLITELQNLEFAAAGGVSPTFRRRPTGGSAPRPSGRSGLKPREPGLNRQNGRCDRRGN